MVVLGFIRLSCSLQSASLMQVAPHQCRSWTQGAKTVTLGTRMDVVIFSAKPREKQVNTCAAIPHECRLMYGRLAATIGLHDISSNRKALALADTYINAMQGFTIVFKELWASFASNYYTYLPGMRLQGSSHHLWQI